MKEEAPRVKAWVVILWLILFWPAVFIYIMMVSSERRHWETMQMMKSKK